ncbi:hypothetical protein [Cytophaga hutchinsonii]|uniref:Uncharacterized protein n=1 Tax=Cytophaga hutchinsonii (strain ATCC 33406 / DSM 1761 / CIP 103989 / NBRC 15051 / NCIMB 9469 / D465) TaxID=269798 RepID=A0A6N4SNM6_CYTH3|nr:hypothetical protein [Cytophaga hutchinsonii]ABG57903.1 hypothetical protein CHU_0616 [Cytophaga hutchinsonii ATCC 33406]SFX08580.1 hypothetical protein SAMN04487930_101456 [Cytophaga hutchinsonii ATCC 33406]
MERNIRAIFAVVCLFLFAFVSQAQQIRQLEAVKIPKQIGCISSDPYGFIYLTDITGNIYKIDSLGKQFVLASPPRRGQITSIEAYRNVNIFVFYSEYQVYYYYDRFLNPSQSLSFSTSAVGFARIATSSLDQNVWLVDDQDFSLKKYNSTYLSVDINTPLDLIIDPEQYNMNFMREYQNLLFINDANSGVLIFDNMGNYKTRIPVTGLTYVSFSEEDLVFLKDGSLHLINIYTYKERIYTNPIFTGATGVILINNRLYVTTKDAVLINFFKE